MQRHLINIVFLLTLLLLFGQCAQVVPLTGGEKDTEPPKLVEAIPEMNKLNFDGTEIILRFNEFVQLKDLNNQLLISPTLLSDPEIEAQGKKIEIRIKKGELKPNTTYRMYFGKAICDMNESNPLKNFEYVFSTGAIIDTLKCNGRIETAFDKSEPGECVVGLYLKANIQSDSFPFKQKPDYLCRSNMNGSFEMRNLPSEKFKCLAFFDKNKNFMYDGESERVAYKEEWFDPKTDTAVALRLFSEKPAKNFFKRSLSPYYGKIMLIYNKASRMEVRTQLPEQQNKIYHHLSDQEKDTLTLYYSGIQDTLKLFIKRPEEGKTDSLTLSLPKVRTGKMKSYSYLTNWPNGIIEKNIFPRLQLIGMADTMKTTLSKIFFRYKKDSVFIDEPAQVRMINPFTVELRNNLKEGINYRLLADTAVFYERSGKYSDSIKESIRIRKASELGRVKIKLLFDKKTSYLVQLINDKNIVTAEQTFSLSLSTSNEMSIEIKDLFPGNYVLKVIYDENQNKKWDTGQLLMNIQPEKVYISSKQIKIMADWDVEEDVSIH